ncbi:MAG: HAMP domain-containing histidine kinase [Clostridia bacterium]|nr:HAMP domain-containing histidine kinase [Clostridia bacterium]
MREEKKKGKKIKEKLRARYTQRVSSTSLFFWVLGAISGVCLLMVLLFGVSQWFVLKNTVQQQMSQDLSVRGQTIKERLLPGLPPQFADEEEHARHLSATYGVNVTVLDGEGRVLYSSALEADSFVSDVAKIKAELGEGTEVDRDFSVYQQGNDGVYVCRLEDAQTGANAYLYVTKDVSYMGIVLGEMSIRILFSALFVFVLAFVVAAIVSGFITKPIDEMKDKAKLLARGDFSVNFHGKDYGREMAELAESLNFARDELSKTDGMQKELIANVSHDFKTPLTMIKAYASMIVEISGEDKKKREKHATVIIEEADRLTSLVGDLLDLSKLQSGIAALSKEEFDLSAYTRQAVEKFGYLQETHGYQFIVDIDDGAIVSADKGKIGQVLHNLIGNAVNYTGDDKKVYISLKRGETSAYFSVRDTGKGISKEALNDIWDRYYRSKETHKRPIQGTGLGLSIVRRVLEMHNLKFGVESDLGKGSVFYVDFPCVSEG